VRADRPTSAFDRSAHENVRHFLVSFSDSLESATARGHEACVAMRYTLYEDPVTHKFALVALPYTFVDEDTLPILPTERWFDDREAAIAAVPELLDREA
jgi:hypothetical protein